MKIPPEAVAAVKTWLRADGIAFFRACQKYHGRIDPCFMLGQGSDALLSDAEIERQAGRRATVGQVGLLPHPVHFREGMEIRNVLRKSGLCKDWSNDDYENLWTEVVKQAII